MASTTETTNLGLTIYQTDDKPTYLVDHNENMQKIDAAYGEVKTAADSADAKATSAGNLAQAASEAVGTAVDKANCAMASASAVAGTADQALTTANTAHQVAESAMDLADSASDDANQALNKLGELVNIDDIEFSIETFTVIESNITVKNGILCGTWIGNGPAIAGDIKGHFNYNINGRVGAMHLENVATPKDHITIFPQFNSGDSSNPGEISPVTVRFLVSCAWNSSWTKKSST